MNNSQKFNHKLIELHNIIKTKLSNLLNKNNLNQSITILDKSTELVDNIKNINYVCLIYYVMNKIISYYKKNVSKNSNLNNDNLDLLVSRTIYILNSQAKFNPPQYISHGVDHSLRTMRYCIDLFTKSKIINEALKTKYNLDPEQNELLLIYLGLFHDIGYSDIEVIYNNDNNDNNNSEYPIMIPKFIHSYSSYKMLKDENFNNLFINTITKDSFEDVILAIKHHNYDSEKCKNQNDPNCLFISKENKFTTYIEAGVRIFREYKTASIKDDPLLFLIRFADNLDFIRDRLSDIQDDITFIKFLKEILKIHYKNNSSEEIKNEEIKNLIDSYIKTNNINDDDKSKMVNSVYKNREDFLHYYGNWIVSKLDIFILDEKFYFKIYFYDIIDENYSDLLFIKNIYPGLYQLDRLFDSYKSLFMDNNTPLLEYINVELNFIHEGRSIKKNFSAMELVNILKKLKETYIKIKDETSIKDLES